MIRVKAFSSRSSASDPATSSTVTNISVTVAATAIANVSSDALASETTSFCDLDRLRDRAQQRQREVQVVLGELGELGDLRKGVARRPGLHLAFEPLEGRARAREPEDVDLVADQRDRERAALDQQVDVVRGLRRRSAARGSGSPR